MDEDLPDGGAVALLAESSAAVRDRRRAEVRDLLVLARWADLHADDPTQGPDGAVARRVGNVLVRPGGEGTPGVQDFCLGEIATARGTGVTATINALADVLDLRHRLPATWAVCRRAEADVWVARRVAKLSRHLPQDCVGVVDAAVARVLGREGAGRVLDVAEGAIVKAAPELHERRLAEEKRRRFVHLSRSDEAGLRMVVARVEAGDAAWIGATLSRVAEIIAPQHPDLTADEVRALAFGHLARPAELLVLLLEHTEGAETTEGAQGPRTTEGAQGPRTTEGAEDAGAAPVVEPEPAPAHDGPNRALAVPADLLEALREADLTRLRPRAVLHVHLHEAALGGHGVARVEGLGPRTLSQLTELLGNTRLSVQPVVDLSDRVRSTAYEHCASLRNRVHLISGGDYWPFATSTSRQVDYDHPTPYVDPGDGGPPGQTGTHNSGPLGRRHHRWKTHAGFRSRQSGEGRYVWVTPHGLGFLVDHRGTRRIDPDDARMILDAPAGVDVHPGEVRVEIDLRR